MPRIRAINAETIQSRVHHQLRELLMLGRFQPGQALKIIELAEAFGTSAQPIRESIRQLIAERALDALPNRSARVPRLSRDRLEDLRRVRLALEGLAAEMAIENATSKDVDALRALTAAGAKADDTDHTDASVRLNAQFHFALYAMARSATLMPLIESIWLQIGPAMRLAADTYDRRDGRGTDMHTRIIEGLARGDKAAVSRAVAEDINRSFDLLVSITSGKETDRSG